MTNDNSVNSAIVFSCDEAYAFLARGLVLSLADVGFPSREVAVILIDIGCEPDTLSWMKDRGIRIVPFDPKLIPQKIMSVIQPVQRAQVVRPWLPELLPQVQHLVWLDCDLWVQNGEFMSLMIAGAHTMPDAVVLAPANSHYHASVYSELHEIIAMQLLWYTSCYEPYLANKAASTLSYSSGVFGMRRTSPGLGALAQGGRVSLSGHVGTKSKANAPGRSDRAQHRDRPKPNDYRQAGSPLQFSLQCGRSRTGAKRPCDDEHDGAATRGRRRPPGQLAELAKDYLSLNLLYRSGDYLSPAERARIAI